MPNNWLEGKRSLTRRLLFVNLQSAVQQAAVPLLAQKSSESDCLHGIEHGRPEQDLIITFFDLIPISTYPGKHYTAHGKQTM